MDDFSLPQPLLEMNDSLSRSVTELRRQLIDLSEEQRRISMQMRSSSDYPRGDAFMRGFSGGTVILLSNIPTHLQHPDAVMFMLEKFGEVEKVKILNKKRHLALVQMRSPGEAERAVAEHEDLFERCGYRDMRIVMSTNVTDINTPKGASNYDSSKDYSRGRSVSPYRYPEEYDYPQQRQSPDGGVPQNHNVVLVSNLPEKLRNVNHLCNLFGMYGDVSRVKIPVNRQDCALIEYAKPHYSQNCKIYLDEAEVEGQKLRVSYSRMKKLTAGTSENQELNKDFSDSKAHHRYKNRDRAQRLLKNLCSPTSTIHVSNLSDEVTDDEVKQFFAEKGFTVKDILDSGSRKGMAVVQLGCPSEGLMALATCHAETTGIKCRHFSGICISFSKRIK